MEANASRLRKHVKRLAEIASKVASKCDPLPGVVLGASSDSGKGTKADRRPLTTTGVVASERIRGQVREKDNAKEDKDIIDICRLSKAIW